MRSRVNRERFTERPPPRSPPAIPHPLQHPQNLSPHPGSDFSRLRPETARPPSVTDPRPTPEAPRGPEEGTVTVSTAGRPRLSSSTAWDHPFSTPGPPPRPRACTITPHQSEPLSSSTTCRLKGQTASVSTPSWGLRLPGEAFPELPPLKAFTGRYRCPLVRFGVRLHLQRPTPHLLHLQQPGGTIGHLRHQMYRSLPTPEGGSIHRHLSIRTWPSWPARRQTQGWASGRQAA